MSIPAPPGDNSGGYLIGQYTNGTDTHRYRLHVRAFDSTGLYATPGAGTPTTVQADWTGLSTIMATFYNTSWTFTMVSLFQNNGDGTFTEVFGWTPPTPIVGSGATATGTDQTRATFLILNFKDGHGGKGRLTLIAYGGAVASTAPVIVAGASSGTGSQKLVDYLSNPVKTNIVSHAGHQYQSPARGTFGVNRRLRRHYGFA